MTPISSPLFQQTFKGAVALNNNGVALLERDCFEQALMTLQSSVQTLKNLFQNTDSAFDAELLDHLTHEAAIRLANPKISASSHSHIQFRAVEGDYVQYDRE